jgi:phosphatidate cytidylyltransferase
VIIGLPVVMGVLIAFASGQYGIILALFVVAMVGDALLEMIRHTSDESLSLYRMGITLAGLIYAGFPPAFLIAIRALPDGLIWVYLIYAVTWGTDTLAYFGGRLWGKHPLAPRISPKKTREGAIVGVIGGLVLGTLLLVVSGHFATWLVPFLILAPPIAVIGDLFESRLKRFFLVGDSHVAGLNVLPGHGGVLDRTDALIWVASLCYVYFALSSMGM